MKKCIIEFIGTFFLVLTIGLTGNPLAIGAVLAAMVYMGGYVSGAHYNPAITLGVWMQEKISNLEAIRYVAAQLLGALGAVIAYQAIHGGKMAVHPSVDSSFIATLLVEIIFTFALVSVVLHTAVSDQTKGNSYYGLAIGAVLAAAAFAGGPISGGAFNPAVGLVPNLYDWSALTYTSANLALYFVGPFLGGLLAGVIFHSMKPRQISKVGAN
ncbi:MAG TPA: aquaporin [Candidatus Saccharimonadales bacterium]|nr:aquaporin [Candidatus Saccharimonadales bacterium]